MRLQDIRAMALELNVGRYFGSLRSGICGGAAFAISLLSSAQAYAVSDRVKSACRDDYFQHCSQFMVDSDELRQCMRKVGEDLSTPCLVALVQDGEITKEDVERHNAAKAAAPKKKDSVIASEDTADPKSISAKPTKNIKASSKKSSKKKRAANAAPAANAVSGSETKHSAKVAKTHPAGKKSKSSIASKKKSKKPKTTHSAAAATETTAGASAPPHAKKTAHSKAKSTTKKKSAGKAVKAKKKSKKKSSAKTATKPVDAVTQ
jgi:adenylate kinase